MKKKINVLVVDGRTVGRKGLSSLLNAIPSLVVVGEAANGAEAVLMTRASYLDIVLLDEQIFHIEGPGTIWRIWQEKPGTPILVLCQSESETAAPPELDANRLWFSCKDCTPEELAQVIQDLINSGTP